MATDLILGIVTKVLECTYDPAKRHLSYAFKCSAEVKELEEKIKELANQKVSLQHKVEEESLRGRAIEKFVTEWQSQVDKAIGEADVVVAARDEEAGKRCFFRLCPNLKSRYLLGRKADVATSGIMKLLKQKDQFGSSISYLAPLQPVVKLPLEGYQAPSRVKALNEVMEALKNPSVKMVGVYGMGGVGKTTLANELLMKVIEEKSFDPVIMATVSRTPMISKIQGEIADMLHIKFEQETEVGRAAFLHENLKEKTKALIILDDLWDLLKLEKVGIPFGSDLNGPKILLTSRKKDVLVDMGSRNNLGLQVLLEEEAKNLFEMTVGEVEDIDLEKSIVQKCSGYPLLVVTVASILKDKNLEAWKDMLRQLSRIDNNQIEHKEYKILEISYDNLVDEEQKSLFLLCGNFGQSTISTRDLLNYCIGLGLFKHIYKVSDARNRLLKLLDDLKSASLVLQYDKEEEQLKMHDVVCDTAASIALRTQHAVIIKDGTKPEEWPRDELGSKCTRISLPYCDISELPQNLECPNIEFFLFIAKDRRSLIVPATVFEGCKKLKVLNFTNINFSSFASLGSLVNLRTLCLDRCKLSNINIIGQLKELEVLSFNGSQLEMLPCEIGQLTKLKSLDLSECFDLKIIAANVLSKLSLLEELYLGGSLIIEWANEEQENGSNASLLELGCLPHLTALEIYIPSDERLPEDLIFSNLERYRICYGRLDFWAYLEIRFFFTRRTLMTKVLKLGESGDLPSFIKSLLKEAEHLELGDIKGIRNVLFDLEPQGFQKLRQLQIVGATVPRHIVDSTKSVQIAFPLLESLRVSELDELESICNHQPLPGSFGRLRILSVSYCTKLRYVSSMSLVRSLSQLEELKIECCENIEVIFIDENDSEASGKEVVEFPRLLRLELRGLDKLESFFGTLKASSASSSSYVPGSPPPLFGEKIAFPLLESLYISQLYEIESICDHQPSPGSFGRLRVLSVSYCTNLWYVSSVSLVRSLSQLEELEINSCKNIEAIVIDEGDNKASESEVLEFPRLLRLELRSLDTLESFFSTLKASSPSSSSYVPSSPPPLFGEKVSFPRLEELSISDMHNLEEIWHNQLIPGSFSKLKLLKVDSCSNLQNIFPAAVSERVLFLEHLDVTSCKLLQEIYQFNKGLLIKGTKGTMASHQLRRLILANLPELKHIWGDEMPETLCFNCLQSVRVSKCDSLKKLFPSTLAKSLSQLKDLDVEECGMEEIISGKQLTAPFFSFPELTSLKLSRLPHLRTFYSGMHVIESPKLQYLHMVLCDKAILPGTFNAQENPCQPPFFSENNMLRNLEQLIIDGKNWKMIADQSPSWIEFPAKLKSLELYSCKGTIPGVFRQLSSLEKLFVSESSFIRLVSSEMQLDHREDFFIPIRSLRLVSIKNMRHVWELTSQKNPLLSGLTILYLQHCEDLISLAPSSLASFWNLTSLKVHNCHRLTTLVTISIAETMAQLENLEIENCSSLKEIVVADEEQLEDEKAQAPIIFGKLETLHLVRLPCLQAFCLRNCKFRFPSLKKIVVNVCPNMRIFSHGETVTPNLKYINTDEQFRRVLHLIQRRKRYLNSRIQEMYKEMVGFKNLDEASLSKFPQLMKWLTGEPFSQLSLNLRKLVVDNCMSLSIVLPSNRLRHLKKLQDLVVENCESVKEVFNLEGLDGNEQVELPQLKTLQLNDLPKLRQIWNIESFHAISGFLELHSLEVHNCSCLKYIFPLPVARGLKGLSWLEVKGCTNLEVIIKKVEEGEDPDGQNLFPSLTSLKIEHLKNLTDFYPSGNVLKFPRLEEISVVNCPKIITYASTWPSAKQDPSTSSGRSEREPDKGNVDAPTLRFLNDQVEIINLERMKIDWDGMKNETWHKLFPTTFLCKLQVAELIGFPDKSAPLPSNFLPSLPNLKKLVVGDCFFKEIFSKAPDTREKHAKMIAKLEELKLFNLPRMEHLFKKEFKHIEVFYNLMTLEISKCSGMTILLTSSTARSLQKLKRLVVEECESLTEIVTSEGDKVEYDVSFDYLEHLELTSLSCLTSFSSGSNAFYFSILEEMVIRDCPRIKTFAKKVFTTQWLQSVQIVERDQVDWRWKSSLNGTIEKLFKEKYI